MRILWAVSSVGKGHVIRDMVIVNQLQSTADVEVDWLAPDPAGNFLRERGYNVLACSSQLSGSGKVYHQVFKDCTDEFNLIEYIRKDTKLHQNDFEISARAWSGKTYDLIVGDEAFWLLTGFSSNLSKKPAPFVFLTDFLGVKAMQPRIGDMITAWFNNLKYTMSHLGPDVYIYIGNLEGIPNERFGFLLPNRRSWAKTHCQFVKPIVSFDPDALPNKKTLRKELGLPVDKRIFIAVVGPEGDHEYRRDQIEDVFECLKVDFPHAHFILVGPEAGTKTWIHHHRYLENLYQYFAASDFALIQSGYGKTIELSALGVPFIAIPLDYHFEQEYLMAHRLKNDGLGKLITLRNHSPEEIAKEAKESLKQQGGSIPVDDGTEIASIILETHRNP